MEKLNPEAGRKLEMPGFEQTMAGLRAAVPLNEEIVRSVSADELEACEALVFGSGSHRAHARFNRRQLACVMRLLMCERDRSRVQILMALLERHTGGTVRRMAFVALQMEPDNPIVLRLVIRLHDSPDGSAPGVRGGRDSCVSWINLGEPLTETVLRHFRQSRQVLPVYMLTQGILRDLPFAWRLRNRFFETCSIDDYTDHVREWHRAFDLADKEKQAAMLARFMMNYKLDGVPDSLVQKLLDRFGPPGEQEEWQLACRLLSHQTDPMTEIRCWWHRLLLQDWWGADSRKVALLMRYIRQIRSIERDEARNLLYIHFPHFVLVDFRHAERCSWLCIPLELELRGEDLLATLRQHAERETRLAEGRDIPDAKRVLFDKIDQSIVQLNYPEVGILYAHDLMDIRLGIKDLELDY